MPTLRKTISKAVYGDATPYEITDDGGIKEVTGNGDHWGTHLLLDFSEANKKIDDEKAIADFFKQLFKSLEIKPLSEFVIKRALLSRAAAPAPETSKR